jgi:hypothetical protein
MKDDMMWSDIYWDSFACFAELYKPLSRTYMAVLEDADEQYGDKLAVSGRWSRRNLGKKAIISGTPSPELI